MSNDTETYVTLPEAGWMRVFAGAISCQSFAVPLQGDAILPRIANF